MTDNDTYLTWDQKVQLYREGRYAFPPPPVCTARWTEDSWIRYVDLHGVWIPNK